MSDNLLTITSAKNFQETLSKDLERVSVTNFWAPWAEPCKQMNEVVAALAKEHPSILFLQVNAEDHYEISESFDINSVPGYVVLRGHTLLGKILGADAPALTKLVEQHSASAIKPLSTSDKTPAAPPATTAAAANGTTTGEEKKEETEEELNARMRALMDGDKVVLFMKGSPDTPRCGFSRQAVAILRENKVPFTHFDILQDEAVRQGLKKYNDWPTFPQIIIGGELAGGLDILKEMVNSGELKEALENVGVGVDTA